MHTATFFSWWRCKFCSQKNVEYKLLNGILFSKFFILSKLIFRKSDVSKIKFSWQKFIWKCLLIFKFIYFWSYFCNFLDQCDLVSQVWHVPLPLLKNFHALNVKSCSTWRCKYTIRTVILGQPFLLLLLIFYTLEIILYFPWNCT